MRRTLSADKARRPIETDETGATVYIEELYELRNRSGVYGIFDARTRRALYIGESHTGRLYDTLTRHFRAWRINPRTDAQGRRFGGTTYDRARVLVDWIETAPSEAQDRQYAEIQRLAPRDNANTGETVISIEDIPT